MIKTFKFAPSFNSEGVAVLGQLPAGRILKSEPILDDGKPYWLIEVGTDPEISPPVEIYQP